MDGINASSKRIADIIGVIDEIAFQTNLLALNAAVEAARAGDQGRGFAVVASEVRNLASRSAEAAKEIKALIKDSVARVEDGARLVTESGSTLDQLVSAVKKVGDIIAEISAASDEQASGIDQVGQAITQMDELTQQNAALVEEAAAASKSLAERASDLNNMLSRYRVNAGRSSQIPLRGDAETLRVATGRAVMNDRSGTFLGLAPITVPLRGSASKGHQGRAPRDAIDTAHEDGSRQLGNGVDGLRPRAFLSITLARRPPFWLAA